MIRIVVADDHSLLRRGLRAYLETNDNFSVVGEATNGLEVGPLVEQLLPDVLILDLTMPGMSGFDVIREVTRQSRDMHIIVLSMHSDEAYVRKAFAYGADAYVVKDSEPTSLSQAIREVMDGHRYLSPSLSERAIEALLQRAPGPANADHCLLTRREQEVLALASSGLNNTQIGAALSISPRTAETHRSRVLRKLGLHSQTELVRYAVRHGILSAED